MLDTNVVSAVIRQPTGPVARRMEAAGASALCVSALVASERRFDAGKKESVRLTSKVEGALARIDVLPYDDAASVACADIRTRLERSGTPIGSTDIFIAAHALSLDLTLVTANIRDFSWAEGLKVENWMEPAP